LFAADGSGVFVVDGQWDALEIDSNGNTSLVGPPQGVPYIPAYSWGDRWYVPVSSGQDNIAGVSQWAMPDNLAHVCHENGVARR
jgi:hypothetical protein